MMWTVPPMTFRPTARALCLAAVLLPAAWLSQAGDASTAFRITVQVIPEAPGSCSASSERGIPRLTCRPTVAGSAASGQGADSRRPSAAVYFRTEAPLRLAGEMIEVGVENYYAWLEQNSIAFSESSSRRVVAGGREYLETTISW
jgi:hypothetical protein